MTRKTHDEMWTESYNNSTGDEKFKCKREKSIVQVKDILKEEHKWK